MSAKELFIVSRQLGLSAFKATGLALRNMDLVDY
jgi:hypothetical protein